MRLIRDILGQDAVADRKVECGNDLVILGIKARNVVFTCFHVLQHVTPRPVCRGVDRWMQSPIQHMPKEMRKVEKANQRSSSIRVFECWRCFKVSWQVSQHIATLAPFSLWANLCAYRLNFANQRLFRRLGRAVIKAVYAQATSKTGIVSSRLQESLRWWLNVLNLNICEEVQLEATRDRGICRLFVDAASTPAHCAAVLFMDGHTLYTNAAPCSHTVSQLAARRDKQITSLVCDIPIMNFEQNMKIVLHRKYSASFWDSPHLLTS